MKNPTSTRAGCILGCIPILFILAMPWINGAPPDITPTTEAVTVDATTKQVTSHPDRALAFKITSANRATTAPPSIGQLAWETDTGKLYRATGTNAGDWSSVIDEGAVSFIAAQQRDPYELERARQNLGIDNLASAERLPPIVRTLPSYSALALFLNRDATYRVVLDHDAAFEISKPVAGSRFSLAIEQGYTGGVITDWGGIHFGLGEPTLSTSAGSVDLIEGSVDASGRILATHRLIKDTTPRGDLIFQFLPDDPTTLTLNGSEITSALGAAGTKQASPLNGSAQLSTDALNGRNTAVFDGVDDVLVGDVLNSLATRFVNGGITVYMVVRSLSHTDLDRYFDGSAEDLRIYQRGAGYGFAAWNGTTILQLNPPTDGGWFVAAVGFSGMDIVDSDFMRFNRLPATSANYGNRSGASTLIGVGGSRSFHSYAHCEIAELRLYQALDNTAAQDRVIADLMHTYGLDGAPAVDDRPFREPPAKLVGHRGGALDTHPENTLACIAEGVRLGVKSIEVDIQKSSDGVLFVMHDQGADGLIRTTNVETVFPGRANDDPQTFTMAELQTLDAGSWKGAAFTGEPIPTLAQVLTYCARNNIIPCLDVKGEHSAAIRATCAEVGFPLARLHISAGIGQTALFQNLAKDVLYCTVAPLGAYAEFPETTPASYIDNVLNNLGADGSVFAGSLYGTTYSAGQTDAWFGIAPIYYLAATPATADLVASYGFVGVWTDTASAFVGTSWLD